MVMVEIIIKHDKSKLFFHVQLEIGYNLLEMIEF